MTKTARVRVPTAWEWLQAGKTRSPLDPAAEAAFFDAIRLSNGTLRPLGLGASTTLIRSSRRPCAARRRREMAPLQLLDVGISSGITTLEWAKAIESLGLDFRLVATDLTATASLHRYGKWFHASGREPWHPASISHLRQNGSEVGSTRAICGASKSCRFGWPQLSYLLLQKAGWGAIEPIPLVVSGVLMNPAIEVCSDDIFCDDPTYHGRFHVIRAANI